MRTRTGPKRARKRKRILKKTRGFRGSNSKLYRMAKQALRRSQRYSWVGRRQKKRDFRRLWITRINAAARMRGINYSRFMGGLKKADVELNRKVLADIALTDPDGFDQIVDLSQENMETEQP